MSTQHTHEFWQLKPTLSGLTCSECRCKWTMPDGFPSFFIALQKHIEHMDDRYQKTVEALLTLGLVSCEFPDCGKWFKPSSSDGFDSKEHGCACVEHLVQWYETHDLETAEPIEGAIARWYCSHETALKSERESWSIAKIFEHSIQDVKNRA